MGKRSWTNIKQIEPQIIAMRVTGKTRREIAEQFDLTWKQIKWWVSRNNREQARQAEGVPSFIFCSHHRYLAFLYAKHVIEYFRKHFASSVRLIIKGQKMLRKDE